MKKDKKRVIVYGTGESARYFLQKYQFEFNIVAVVDKDPKIQSLGGFPVLPQSQLRDREFDAILVASWAILEIVKRLEAMGICEDDILWFQHNRNQVVDKQVFSNMTLHPEYNTKDILYCFYDLDVARATYDILGFLCIADVQKQMLGLKQIHVVIVCASNVPFNLAAKGILSTEEHDWRKRHILQQCCALLPSVCGVTVTSTKAEAQALMEQATSVFPEGYDVASPVAKWEFNHLFDLVKKGINPYRLQSSPTAREYIASWVGEVNPQNKKIITITLRQSSVKPARNSNINAWRQFIMRLDGEQFLPVVIPDTENYVVSETNCEVFVPACFDVELRMALYEAAYVNLGVNNGPLHLCVMSSTSRYIMYKKIVDDYNHSSRESFVRRGFDVGEDFPGAQPFQKLSWEEDTLDVIESEFLKLHEQIANKGKQ